MPCTRAEPGGTSAERAGDVWDLHQLLSHHNRRGQISDALLTGPEPLRLAGHTAAQRVLVDGAARTPLGCEPPYVGRIPRPYPGKVTAQVHDYQDLREGVLASSLAKCASGYLSLGFPDPR